MNRKIIDALKQWTVWSSSSRARSLLLLIQVLFAASGTVFTSWSTSKYSTIAQLTFYALLTVLILWAVITLIANRRFGINILASNLETGMLYDKGTNIENVSLRRSTISRLLDGVTDKADNRAFLLHSIGKDVGSEFVEDYSAAFHNRALEDINRKELLKELYEYDSSSGMGKFCMTYHNEKPEVSSEVVVKNFLTCHSVNNQDNCFLAGYIVGVMEAVYKGKQFKVTTEPVDYREQHMKFIINEEA